MRLRRACGLTLKLFFALWESSASEGALSAGVGCRAENFFKTAPRVACPTNLGLKQGKERTASSSAHTVASPIGIPPHGHGGLGTVQSRQRTCGVGFFLEQKL